MVSAPVVSLNRLLMVAACLLTLLFCKGRTGRDASVCVQRVSDRGGVLRQVRDAPGRSPSHGHGGWMLPQDRRVRSPRGCPAQREKRLMAASRGVTRRVQRVTGNFIPVGISSLI